MPDLPKQFRPPPLADRQNCRNKTPAGAAKAPAKPTATAESSTCSKPIRVRKDGGAGGGDGEAPYTSRSFLDLSPAACPSRRPPSSSRPAVTFRRTEALLVAYGAMSGANLRAVDRVVKMVGKPDRYHRLFV